METKQVLWDMGERISARRKELKITQEELADRMDVSIQMISYLEAGRKAIRPENLIKLCNALEVSADYILTGQASNQEYDRITRKLQNLSPEEFRSIEAILDNCIALAGKQPYR